MQYVLPSIGAAFGSVGGCYLLIFLDAGFILPPEWIFLCLGALTGFLVSLMIHWRYATIAGSALAGAFLGGVVVPFTGILVIIIEQEGFHPLLLGRLFFYMTFTQGAAGICYQLLAWYAEDSGVDGE
ncbi:MAG: hypothetical protein AB7W16_21185 [Candidatus Obscuribacterales bacterium]